jgi:site-specific recombinase XerD
MQHNVGYMSIIIKCRQCKTRLDNDIDPCPSCGSDSRVFVLDYMFDGRHSKRIRQELPDSIKTYAEAAAIENVRNQIKRKKLKTYVTPDGATVKHLFPEYLKWVKEHRSKTTHADINRTYEAHIKRILGDEIICMLSTENYDYYQTYRLADIKRHSKGPVKNRTINKELNYFSGFTKWCRRHKKINVQPILYDSLPAPKPKPDILTFEEIIKIIKAARPDKFYYAFILTLYTLGLRFSEATSLTMRHFNFTAKSVKVIQKGGEDKVLPVADILIKAIKALKIQDPDEYIFRDRRKKITTEYPHGRPIKNIRLALDKICEKAKIKKDIHPHMFRHSFATHMLSDQVNMRIIQKFLGHTQISTTEIYTHVALDNLRSGASGILDRINNGLSRHQISQ